MESRIETLLNSVVKGDSLEGFTPQSRAEEYLLAVVNKSRMENLPKPQSRLDALLYKIVDMKQARLDAGKKDFLTERNGKYLFYYHAGKTIPLKYNDTSDITDATYMFGNATLLTMIPLLDTSRVTDMNCMFYYCTALTTIPLLDTSKVTNMKQMFYTCKALTTIPLLDTSKVTDMSSMFYACEKIDNIPNIDTSNATNMKQMFYGCKALTTIPKLDTSKVTDMERMFYNCTSLEEAPELDFSVCQRVHRLFYGCTLLKNVPKYDLSKSSIGTLEYAFYNCKALETAPEFVDTIYFDGGGDPRYAWDGVMFLNYMFENCTSLKDVSSLVVFAPREWSSCFSGCTSLEEVPLLNTSKSTATSYMFSGCTALKKVPELDLRKVSVNSSMFNNCKALEEVWIKNINANLTVGSGTTYGHLIKQECLIHLVKELLKSTSAKTLTIGTSNLNKLANVYVKLVDVTDEMRAEDDLIDKKYPFEVCESTDDGAMLITDYTTTIKNWTIK